MEERIGAGVPDYVLAVMQTLAAAGKRGYPVGGCVRDLLRGVPPHDFDMTTDATPEEMLSIFKAFRVIPTGLAHGTVTVLSEGHPIEITTHRTDGAYSDSRRPDSVRFTGDLTGDLARRDFTVNAMAWHPDRGLIDPFGGREDLARGLIRAVGEPALRFGEDALRILRCFRFAAQLDFEIDPDTLAGAAAMKEGLGRIAAERIAAELCRLLESPAAARGLVALDETGCTPFVFPDTAPDLSILPRLSALPAEAALRMAALLSQHTAGEARALCRRLRTPNAFADAVCGYLDALDDDPPHDPYTARRFVCRRFGCTEGALALHAALRGADVTEAAALCRRVIRDRTAVEIRRLAVNGRELQEQLGVAPADTGKLLARLQDAVWRDPAANRKKILLAAARDMLHKEK